MTTSIPSDNFGMGNHRSPPSLLECIEMRNWQKAMDLVSVDGKAVYQINDTNNNNHNNHNGRRMTTTTIPNEHNNNNNNNNHNHNNNHNRLAIHELCKITTYPTSVRFSKDELSDDEEDDDDDDDGNGNGTSDVQVDKELDQIFDACELEEGSKIYEVTQFMIDVSHSLGPIRVAIPLENDDDDDDGGDGNYNDNDNNNDVAPIEPNDVGIAADDADNDDENRIDDHQQQQEPQNDDNSSHSRNTDDSNNNALYRSHESILTVTDSMGKTPLHILCENSCDLNMMRVILGSTRENTGNLLAPTALSLILAKDSRGSTPLHYLAYSRQCPFSSLKLMMEYCKPTPPHHNSMMMMKDDGQQQPLLVDPTLCTDDDGDTPLHWALDGYMSSRRIKELTRHTIDAVMVQNQKGKRPFDKFTSNFVDSDWTDHDICGQEVWENIQEYLRVIHDNHQNTTSSSTTIQNHHHRRKMDECDYNVDDDDDVNVNVNVDDCSKISEWLPLHFIVGSPQDFPPIFTDLALNYCEADLQKADANGMLPLHLACGRQSKSIDHLNSDNNNNNNKPRSNSTDSVAKKILAKFPRGCLRVVTTTKRLALHLAVRTRKPMSLIAALIKNYPRSLNIPDPVTKLWPYVLVCAIDGAGAGTDAENDNDNDNDNNNNNESLSVSFALLRADPSVLHLVEKAQRISNLTEKERLRWTTGSSTSSRSSSSNLDEEEKEEAEESYMEHSSRRIRRLTIRD